MTPFVTCHQGFLQRQLTFDISLRVFGTQVTASTAGWGQEGGRTIPLSDMSNSIGALTVFFTA